MRRALAARDEKGESALHIAAEDEAALGALVDSAEAAFQPLAVLDGQHDIAMLLKAHAAVLEALTVDAAGRVRVWRGDDGTAAFDLFALGEAAAAAQQGLRLADYAHTFDQAVRTTAVRHGAAPSPRQHLGPAGGAAAFRRSHRAPA